MSFDFERHTVVLHGPPGSGKTTLVRQFKQLLFEAHDLESAPWQTRDSYLNTVFSLAKNERRLKWLIIGAADKGKALRAALPTAHHILLLPRPDVYYARREARDLAVPRKADQPDYYPNFERWARNEPWTKVLDNVGSAEATVTQLVNMFHMDPFWVPRS